MTNTRKRLVECVLMLIAILALAGCAATEFIGYKMNPDFPEYKTENLDLPGLSGVATIYFDEIGVAHIEASNELDLLRAVGYVQGRDRFFGMDMFRRFARGQVAELLGEQEVGVLAGTTIDVDLSMRGWGFDSAVKEDVKGLSPEERQRMQAFVDGVNHSLKLHMPLEYRLLGVEPKPWTIEDSYALGRIVAWGITHNWHQETSRLLLALSVGLERGEQIYNSEYWHGGMSIPDKDVTRELLPAIAPELAEIIKPRPYAPVDADKVMAAWTNFGHAIVRLSGASNAWAVSGDRSASGLPLVASDPHMSHFLPSFFYQQHIKAPGIDVIGATVAGLPYIFSGHNRNVAWGVTSSVADVIDLYIEKPDPDNPNGYITALGPEDYKLEKHVIRVRDGKKFTEKSFTIRRSIHGPVLNDMYPTKFPEWAPAVTYRWNPIGVPESLAAFRNANMSETVEELMGALHKMTALSNTILAADVHGSIAIFATGAVPVRTSHLGTFPVPGWLDKYEWAGFLMPDKNPQAIKKSGFFAHGNNLMINPEHNDMFFNIDSAPSYRVDRITELLEAKPKHDWTSMAEIQGDVLLKRAQRVLPHILEDLNKATNLTEMEQQALKLMNDWNYVASVDSASTAVFFVTYREAIMHALMDEVDPHGFAFIMSQRYSTNVADLWFDRSDHVVWDNRGSDNVELRADVLVPAFKRAVAQLAEKQGDSPSDWQWGKLHEIHMTHFFGSKKALANFINLPPFPVGGGLDSVWKSHFDLGHPKTPFRALAGPAYRMIVDFGDIDHGYWISDTGTSGWPASPHYGDQHPMWLNVKYAPMLYDWKEIQEKAKAVITLSKPVEVEKAEK